MDDASFRKESEAALDALFTRLAAASDRYGMEPDLNAGALVIEFDGDSLGGAAKFVISPNAPVHQIWISANLTSYKLDWDAAAAVFRLAATGETLVELLAAAMSKHLGQPVTL
jgi:iron donor protein CyaY